MTFRHVTVDVPIRTVSELNRRDHHMARHRRVTVQRGVVALVLRATLRGRPPTLPLVVRLVRVAPRDLDEGDNLAAALKAVRDQVAVEVGLPLAKMRPRQKMPVADDRDPRVSWEYAQERGDYAVRIEIRGVS